MSDAGLGTRYQQVKEQIARACADANRSLDEVTLVVVTKNHPVDLVESLLKLGHRDFGENRDQEVAPKAKHLLENSPFDRQTYRWHFIGQLQTNKVKSVLNYADFIHSLDRESLLTELTKQTRRIQSESDAYYGPGVFIQLNLTKDENRGGINSANLTEFAEKVLQVESLKLCGVMAVASLDQEPEHDFEMIQVASQKLVELAPEAKFISAGMSGDFELALKYGATHLRIGTAITGNR